MFAQQIHKKHEESARDRKLSQFQDESNAPWSAIVAGKLNNVRRMHELLGSAQPKLTSAHFSPGTTDVTRQNARFIEADYPSQVLPSPFTDSEDKHDDGDGTALHNQLYVSNHNEQNCSIGPNKNMPIQKSDLSLIPFPQKIMKILEEKKFEHIISWLPHGKSFVVLQKDAFESEILPIYFKESKYCSFARRLRRWGFVRASTNTYTHKKFRRGNYLMCTQVNHEAGSKRAENKGRTPEPPAECASPNRFSSDHLEMEDKNVHFESHSQDVRLPSSTAALVDLSTAFIGDVRNSQLEPTLELSCYMQSFGQQLKRLKEKNRDFSVGAFPYNPVTSNSYSMLTPNLNTSELLVNMTIPTINLASTIPVTTMLQHETHQNRRYLSNGNFLTLGNTFQESLDVAVARQHHHVSFAYNSITAQKDNETSGFPLSIEGERSAKKLFG